MVAIARWDAIGTWCEILTVDDDALPAAAELARDQVQAVDQACSRFRTDSELESLAHGRPVPISPLLTELLDAALRTAASTRGLVDPTIGAALRGLGYDADLTQVQARGAAALKHARVPGWRRIDLDVHRRTVAIPHGVHLDLGASAKAWTADWIADTCQQELGTGVLVNLGGDIAVRGPIPAGGWQIEIDDGGQQAAERPIIAMTWPGGLATSSTVVRTWATAEGRSHHIVDPRTGRSAAPVWRAVSVAARSCERANAASTAAVVLADEAPRWLTQRELPARLAHTEGLVVATNGWPRQRWAA